MFKRIGLFALTLVATGAALLPNSAFAQEQYYASRDSYYHSDRYQGDRVNSQIRNSDRKEWKDSERDQDRRVNDERREHQRKQDRYSHSADREDSFGIAHRR
jgi:hypothetical protein